MKLWGMTVRRSLIGLAMAACAAIALPAYSQQAVDTPTARTPAPTAPASSATPAEGSTPATSAAGDPSTPAIQAKSDSPGQMRPILPPADPAAAAAFSVLDKHCARCHQGGRLDRAVPAAGLGNILRLDEIAAAPFLIQPGNPDASRLYVMMLRRLMPFDVHEEQPSLPPPTPDEISIVRTWISGIAPHPVCRDRRLVSPSDHARALAVEASKSPGRVRFLSIAHLHNGCVGFETLKAYRQAIAKLVNSLSWKPGLVPLPPVDDAATLFRIDLDDLGWLPEHWERIMRSGSDPLGLTPPLPVEVRLPFATTIPIARADWFADTVLRAPLYYEVLGLPGTGPEIQKVLQVDQAQLLRNGGILRGAAKPSQFSVLPSLVERFATRTGGLWTGYHAIARDNSFDPSLAADKPLEDAIPHHASRTMFTLPNGLPAFYIVGQRGDRLDAVPPDIARRWVNGRSGLRAGLDCMACHGSGPVERDSHLFPRPMADAAKVDRASVADAHRRLAIAPGLTLDGIEPTQALAMEYSRPLDGVRAVAELGVELADLLALADQGDKPGAVLARRLVQGLVTRPEMEIRGRELSLSLGRPVPEVDSPAANSSTKPDSPGVGDTDTLSIDPGPGLILYSDKARYKKGDHLNLFVKVTSDCHLTLISIDQRGRGTVVFPSDFETSTLLTAGQELRLPGPSSPYSFRLAESGREHIVALCNEAGAATDGIRHDFERQRFTDLGNYSTFLNQTANINDNGTDRTTVQKSQTRQRGRRRGRAEPPETKARPEQISRTAITIVVE